MDGPGDARPRVFEHDGPLHPRCHPSSKRGHERTHLGVRLGKPQARPRKDGTAEVEAAELLAALEGEQAEEVERSDAVSAFDEEPVTE